MLVDLIQRGELAPDIEFGNAAGTFSGHNRGIDGPDVYGAAMRRAFEGHIPNAKIKVEEWLNIDGRTGEHAVNFTPLEDSRLFDFVSRFVIISNMRPATIGTHKISHSDTNIYYQYAVDRVQVPIGENGWVTFEDLGSTTSDGFEKVFYIRDERTLPDGRKRWIVHHRAITIRDRAQLILRGCNPRFDRALPMQRAIPRALKLRLYRIRESERPNFPLMSIGEIIVLSGQSTSLRTKVSVDYG